MRVFDTAICIQSFKLQRSKDMKEDPKRRNKGDFGWLGSLKVMKYFTVRYSA